MQIRHRNKLLILLALAAFVLTTGAGCDILKRGSLNAQKELEKKVSLEIWGVFDGSDAFAGLISDYTSSRRNVSIKYRKLQFDEYERALLEAVVEGRGPDIFMVHNTWVGSYLKRLSPAPESIKVVVANLTGGEFNRKEEAYFIEYAAANEDSVRSNFVSVVAQDVIRDGQLYGLPLSVDTMVLYYNRALLDQAGVPGVPRTWQEVKEASQGLTVYDGDGEIVRSGISLGGAYNVNRSFDILSLLMAQNGTTFLAPGGGNAMFAEPPLYSSDKNYFPGEKALQFYTDFANSGKEVYTWSEELPSAQEQFVSGNLGMMLGYAYQLPFVKAQGPKVNVGIAPLPHINIDGTDATGEIVNWANYWLLSVERSSDNSEHAWDFIHYVTTKPDKAQKYLDKTRKPTALRSLIGAQLNDPEMSIFANQLLTAKSWYTGKNAAIADNAFRDMIVQVAANKILPREAIRLTQNIINQTLR